MGSLPIPKGSPWNHGYKQAWWNAATHRTNAKPPISLFCTPSVNECYPGEHHPNGDGACCRSDFKCWFHDVAEWKATCSVQCGFESLAFSPGAPEPADHQSRFAPNCSTSNLYAGTLVIDEVPTSVPANLQCAKNWTNAGTFAFTFPPEIRGGKTYYPSKVDLHQISSGFGGHFWFAHTRQEGTTLANRLKITGTWTLNRALTQWARVLVHTPDHGAHTQKARYDVHLGNGTVQRRTALQRTRENKWVSLGTFLFSGVPRVELSTLTDPADGSEDIAYDAIAFQLLPGKPRHSVVAMGD